MGVAYFIVLDNDDPGFDTFVNGKALAREKKLDALCRKIGLKTFEDFLTVSFEDLADSLDEDIEFPEDGEVKWFSAEEGLSFVSALTLHIQANPKSVKNAAGCLQDLAQYADILEKTRDIGAKWHLEIDF